MGPLTTKLVGLTLELRVSFFIKRSGIGESELEALNIELEAVIIFKRHVNLGFFNLYLRLHLIDQGSLTLYPGVLDSNARVHLSKQESLAPYLGALDSNKLSHFLALALKSVAQNLDCLVENFKLSRI